jgi:hypothetical protein
MADDVDKGMLLIEQHHVPQEAALFVLSLVRAARRALLSAEGIRWNGRWRCWISRWKMPQRGGGMNQMPEPRELDPVAAGLIRAGLTGDKFTTDRILTRAFEVDLDGLFLLSWSRTWQAGFLPRRAVVRRMP